MIEEEGVVVESAGGMAQVSILAKSACEKCSAAEVCHPGEQEFMEVSNPLGAVKGQKVRVVIAPQVYMKASIILYGIPMAVFIAAAIAGKNLGIRFGSEAGSDLWAFIAGFSCMLVSFFFIRRYNKKVEKTGQYKPVIVEIIG